MRKLIIFLLLLPSLVFADGPTTFLQSDKADLDALISDALRDSDFSSAGIMFTDGVGNYSVEPTSYYELKTSNNIDPDRLLGDITDDNLLDVVVLNTAVALETEMYYDVFASLPTSDAYGRVAILTGEYGNAYIFSTSDSWQIVNGNRYADIASIPSTASVLTGTQCYFLDTPGWKEWDGDSWEAIVTGGGGYTNLTEFVDQTAWQMFYSNADGDIIELPLDAEAGYALVSNGATVPPTWQDIQVTLTGSQNEILLQGASNDITSDAGLTYDPATDKTTTNGEIESGGEITVPNATFLRAWNAAVGATIDIVNVNANDVVYLPNSFTLPNNTYFQGIDNAGTGYVSMFKVDTSDVIITLTDLKLTDGNSDGTSASLILEETVNDDSTSIKTIAGVSVGEAVQTFTIPDSGAFEFKNATGDLLLTILSDGSITIPNTAVMGWLDSLDTETLGIWLNSDNNLETSAPLLFSDLTAATNSNIPIILGDAAGATALNVYDTAYSLLFSVKSDGAIEFAPYERNLVIEGNGAVLGATAPQPVTIGTFRGYGFDADAETVDFTFKVPLDWDGVSDMELEIYWSSESGDAIADTEVVIFDISYRVIDFTANDVLDGGTTETGTVTYTQSGAGVDKSSFESEIVFDYDSTNQPLAKGETVGVVFNRDITTEGANSYSGDAIVYRWEIKYTSVGPSYE